MPLTRTENGKILYNGFKLELFVPEEWFKNALAEEVGVDYSIFGAVKALHYASESQTRAGARSSFLYFPSKFTTSPSLVTQEKVDFGTGEEKYRIFTYYKDSVLFTNSTMIKSSDNIEFFMNLLMNGKLDMVKYSKIPTLLTQAKYYNGISFNTPAMYEETIISDYYRDPDNVQKPARFAAAMADDDFHAKGITQRNKISFISTFSGLSYEDINSMLTLADNNKRNGSHEMVSDIEAMSIDRNVGVTDDK